MAACRAGDTLVVTKLDRLARSLPDARDIVGLADARDRTLLLFGFAGALRRSELVALNVDDVSEDDAGLRLVLRKSIHSFVLLPKAMKQKLANAALSCQAVKSSESPSRAQS